MTSQRGQATAPAKTVEARAEQRHGIARIDPNTKTGAMVKSAAADQIVTRHGKLSRVVSDVTLRMSTGEIYTIDKGASFSISAEGYRSLNNVAGMAIVDTPYVVVDGEHKPNPHIIRDPKSNQILEIYIRRGIVGRAENGNIVALSQTIQLSPESYFRAELLAAVRRQERWSDEKGGYVADDEWSDAGRLAPIVYDDAGKPRLRDGELEAHEALYPFDDTVGIVVDLRSAEIGKILGNKSEMLKFALRKVQTVIDRRLMHAHPGMPRPKIPGSKCIVTRGQKGRQSNAILEAEVTLRVMGWVETTGEMSRPLRVAASFQETGQVDGADLVQELRETTASAVVVEDDPEISADQIAPARVIDIEAAAEPAEAPQRPSEQSATPNPANVKAALVDSIRLNLATLRKLKNGNRIASDLLSEHTDGNSELIDHREEQLREFLAASLKAIDTAKKSS